MSPVQPSRSSRCGLTSIRQPAYEVGRTAAQMLVEECLGGEHTHRHVVFSPELVIRDSTCRAPRQVARKVQPRKK
jgi:LacI family transcriptional regulator